MPLPHPIRIGHSLTLHIHRTGDAPNSKIGAHATLNPLLFNNGVLKLLVRNKLLADARKFKAFLDIPNLDVEDVILTGSNASYNYTDNSDIDVHLLVDFDKLPFKEIADSFFMAEKQVWNDKYQARIYGMPVEFYVQDVNNTKDPLVANGVYSLTKNAWVKTPGKLADVDQNAVTLKYNYYKQAIDTLLDNPHSVSDVDALGDRIYDLRKSGLEHGGELSVENVVFKQLRTNGDLQRLDREKQRLANEELSLDTRDQFPIAMGKLLTEYRKKMKKSMRGVKVFGGPSRDAYDPNEARDPTGKWTSGGGSARKTEEPEIKQTTSFVSPNEDPNNLSFEQAQQGLRSPRQKLLAEISHTIDSALGIRDIRVNHVIGAWSDGAENSVMTNSTATDPDIEEAAACMKAYLANQKAVLLFHPDEEGHQFLAQFRTKGSLAEVHNKLLKLGVAFHTLEPRGVNDIIVHFYGERMEDVQLFDKAAKSFDNAQVHVEAGHGKFIPPEQKQDGTDAEQREFSRQAYQQTIQRVGSAGKLGEDYQSRWQNHIDNWERETGERIGQSRSADAFDPNEPRDPTGKWTAGGGSAKTQHGGTGEPGRREPGGVQPSRNRSVEQAQTEAARATAGTPKLVGLPDKPITLKDGDHYVPGPIGKIHDTAEQYMKSAGLSYNPPKTHKPVDKERATRIAQAFDQMEHNPNDPKVKAAYQALARETLAQWQAVKKTGLKVEWIKPGQQDPYADTPRRAAMDVQRNNHWWGFPTDMGFGTGEEAEAAKKDNPLLEMTDEVVDGHRCCVNDLFRIVHDYFGHFKDGNGFRASGEENAWRSHASMYSKEALPAVTSETRGQNSWVNFGPYGETNRTTNAADTHYAPQKIGIMPEWTWSEGREDDADNAKAKDPKEQDPEEWYKEPENEPQQYEEPDEPLNPDDYPELHEPQPTKAPGSFKPPKKTIKAYKLFETKKDQPGRLFPLFIGAKDSVPLNEWMEGKNIPTKSFAPRPGWHAGVLPMAPHLRDKSEDKKIAPSRVWAEVEIPDDVDWQKEADKFGRWTKAGKWQPGEIKDRVPVGGHYKFNTKPGQGGTWVIGGAMKVNKVLSDQDVHKILMTAGKPEDAIKETMRDQPFPFKTKDRSWRDVIIHTLDGVFRFSLRDAAVFKEEEHPRGQPKNAGEFVSKGKQVRAQQKQINTPPSQQSRRGKREAGEREAAKREVAQRQHPQPPPRDLSLPLKNSKGHPGLISTAQPKNKQDEFNQPSLESMEKDPKQFKANLMVFDNPYGYPLQEDELYGSDHEVARHIVDHVKANLKYIYNHTPQEQRDHTKNWYDGARKLVDQHVEKYKDYDLKDTTVAGVYAALSPNNLWDQNVRQGDQMLDIFLTKQNEPWDKKMDGVQLKGAPVLKVFDQIKGKKLSQLSDPVDKALWIRVYDQAHNTDAKWNGKPLGYQPFHKITPEGERQEWYLTKVSKKPQAFAWTSMNLMAKAVTIMEANGDRQAISDAMGNKHKIRSFYNNILDPNSDNGDVTMDTHAIDAAWLMDAPIAVAQNFKNVPMKKKRPQGWIAGAASSVKTGNVGTYGIYATAYREAAKELHIQPRQLQSIVWETKREWMVDIPKDYENKIEKVWDDYRENKYSLNQAQDQVKKLVDEAASKKVLKDEPTTDPDAEEDEDENEQYPELHPS